MSKKGFDIMAGKSTKSTRSLGYNVKGTLDLDNMELVEVIDADTGEVMVHDLNEILAEFDGKELTVAISEKSKLTGSKDQVTNDVEDQDEDIYE